MFIRIAYIKQPIIRHEFWREPEDSTPLVLLLITPVFPHCLCYSHRVPVSCVPSAVTCTCTPLTCCELADVVTTSVEPFGSTTGCKRHVFSRRVRSGHAKYVRHTCYLPHNFTSRNVRSRTFQISKINGFVENIARTAKCSQILHDARQPLFAEKQMLNHNVYLSLLTPRV